MTGAKNTLEAQHSDPGKCSVPGCQNRWTVHMHGEKPMCSMHHQRGISPSERLQQEPQKPFMEVDKDDDL
jgi:hypothetical protein